MPTMPLPLTGAPTTDAVDVPWDSSSFDVNVCVFNATVFGRPANSSCETSTPEAISVTGFPGPGPTHSDTPTCEGHHSLVESGSVNWPKKPSALLGSVPIGRSGV